LIACSGHQLGEQKTRVAKLQGELDKLNVTLKQVEKYNEEMKVRAQQALVASGCFSCNSVSFLRIYCVAALSILTRWL